MISIRRMVSVGGLLVAAACGHEETAPAAASAVSASTAPLQSVVPLFTQLGLGLGISHESRVWIANPTEEPALVQLDVSTATGAEAPLARPSLELGRHQSIVVPLPALPGGDFDEKPLTLRVRSATPVTTYVSARMTAPGQSADDGYTAPVGSGDNTLFFPLLHRENHGFHSRLLLHRDDDESPDDLVDIEFDSEPALKCKTRITLRKRETQWLRLEDGVLPTQCKADNPSAFPGRPRAEGGPIVGSARVTGTRGPTGAVGKRLTGVHFQEKKTNNFALATHVAFSDEGSKSVALPLLHLNHYGYFSGITTRNAGNESASVKQRLQNAAGWGHAVDTSARPGDSFERPAVTLAGGEVEIKNLGPILEASQIRTWSSTNARPFDARSYVFAGQATIESTVPLHVLSNQLVLDGERTKEFSVYRGVVPRSSGVSFPHVEVGPAMAGLHCAASVPDAPIRVRLFKENGDAEPVELPLGGGPLVGSFIRTLVPAPQNPGTLAPHQWGARPGVYSIVVNAERGYVGCMLNTLLNTSRPDDLATVEGVPFAYFGAQSEIPFLAPTETKGSVQDLAREVLARRTQGDATARGVLAYVVDGTWQRRGGNNIMERFYERIDARRTSARGALTGYAAYWNGPSGDGGYGDPDMAAQPRIIKSVRDRICDDLTSYRQTTQQNGEDWDPVIVVGGYSRGGYVVNDALIAGIEGLALGADPLSPNADIFRTVWVPRCMANNAPLRASSVALYLLDPVDTGFHSWTQNTRAGNDNHRLPAAVDPRKRPVRIWQHWDAEPGGDVINDIHHRAFNAKNLVWTPELTQGADGAILRGATRVDPSQYTEYGYPNEWGWTTQGPAVVSADPGHGHVHIGWSQETLEQMLGQARADVGLASAAERTGVDVRAIRLGEGDDCFGSDWKIRVVGAAAGAGTAPAACLQPEGCTVKVSWASDARAAGFPHQSNQVEMLSCIPNIGQDEDILNGFLYEGSLVDGGVGAGRGARLLVRLAHRLEKMARFDPAAPNDRKRPNDIVSVAMAAGRNPGVYQVGPRRVIFFHGLDGSSREQGCLRPGAPVPSEGLYFLGAGAGTGLESKDRFDAVASPGFGVVPRGTCPSG